jgi:hypothetical protein
MAVGALIFRDQFCFFLDRGLGWGCFLSKWFKASSECGKEENHRG